MGRGSISSIGSGNGRGNGNGHGFGNGNGNGHGFGNGNGNGHGFGNGNGRGGSPTWRGSGGNGGGPRDCCYPDVGAHCCTPWYCPPNRPTEYPPPIFIPYRVDWYMGRLC